MTKYTEVINETNEVITLKQGSANVFSVVCKVQPKKTHHIRVDESTTYREYWCAVQPTSDSVQEKVVFSSDDCVEFKKVRIFEVGPRSGRYKWEGISRHKISPAPKPLLPTPAQLAAEPTSAQLPQAMSPQEVQVISTQEAQVTSTETSPSLTKRITNVFKWK